MPDNCRRCKCRPRLDGLSMCAYCREKVRIQNKRRRAVKREWEREYDRRRGIRPQEVVSAEFRGRREHIIRLVRLFAEEHGRVPTLAEISRIMGNRPTSGHGCGTQKIRRDAFGLRKLGNREKCVVIPYPVPDEYLDTEWIEKHA